ncbi:hypothetical protein [Thermaerobacillus caldiproteolyticus]|uniref:Uncharacterized protein n=1 Tax=Thermaerobacillus caldiproteolyticus TaxID=247480 RepID=A0A7V9Z434_9BACL|nr:hypothetical protein [Anoxybacillus caldiproteolyticus]MBA2873674.1 hypothetical protein [Anoxybacillus caldiproteolyticus]
MNDKGYSLVVTLLIITIFFILGLTILSASIYQAKFTEVRVQDVESLHEATQAIEETIAEMKVEIEKLELSTPLQLDADLATFLPALQEKYKVTIQDITNDKQINRTKLFTRVYIISKSSGAKTVSRQVILTNTPSFLKYAIGSNEDVTLNGGAYIDGNIYAGKDFYVTNVANYIDNSQKYIEQTSFPTTSETSILFVNGSHYSCDNKNGADSCYDIRNNRFERVLSNYSNDVHFQSQGPSVQKEQDEFIDVDFDWTFKDKLLNAAGIETFSQQYEANIDKSSEQLLNEFKKQFTIFDNAHSLKSGLSETSNQSILLESNELPSFFIDSGEINLKDKWLVVNGDLFLGNSVNKPVKVRGNILVFGNLTISGNVQLDSTIYVLNRTFIYNANISGWDDKQVVLLSKGPLEIARINEFNNSFSFDKSNLKGYFYTDSNAVLYTVGSYINIKGGLFARGNENETVTDADTSGLVINTYRGSATKQNGTISFTPPSSLDKKEQARFVIRHDKSVFIDRGLGLPFVKKLDVIVDKLTVK